MVCATEITEVILLFLHNNYEFLLLHINIIGLIIYLMLQADKNKKKRLRTFNSFMWGSLRLAPINTFVYVAHVHLAALTRLRSVVGLSIDDNIIYGLRTTV